jgi:hypothetical protein
MSIHQDRIVASTLSAVCVGDTVCTSDNEELGKVSEVTDTAIKVAEPLHAAYWIAGDYVLRAEEGNVALSFMRKDVGAYRMNAPHAQVDPLVEQESDRVIGDEEQAEVRVRMERELAEQRESLSHMHPGGSERPPDTFGTLGEPVEDELARTTGKRPSPSHDDETVATGGIANMAGLWLAGMALLGVVGASAAWRWKRRSRSVPVQE